jgi:hypothetical protein
MSTESDELIVIQSKLVKTGNLQAYKTQNIGLTGLVTYIIQITVNTIVRQRIKVTSCQTLAVRIKKAQRSRMSLLQQILPD